MTRNFEIVYNNTVKAEGFRDNDSIDKREEIYCGIARKFHPNWKGWKHIDWWETIFGMPKSNQIFAKLNEDVMEFYYNTFWNNIRLNDMPMDLSKILYDVAVNMGSCKAIEFIQKALNTVNIEEKLWEDLKVDEIIGNKTIKTINIVDVNYMNKWKEVKIWYTHLKGFHYINITENNES